ncbi:hypothetical protein BB560_000258 [Smittium megazygosporum]|uniref:SH3 domain-containing protein n=1 Tax=Smittium megazygosporum TaxID=133381 RepID=A0A2T9YG01_9FUNG|nr:hypothetical protein BB560_006136 [Smittium megazygosporum]PVV05221.1 hypothetical protein BB560_000258 [Smittium megazygosporum]
MEPEIEIYDFAYPRDDPRHKGVYPAPPKAESVSNDQNDDWPEEEDLEQQILGKAEALYDFVGENEGELNFSKGDILILTRRNAGGWIVGYKGDEIGLVPENFVKLLKDK